MDVDALVSDATARIEGAADSAALEDIRIETLGRKAPLVQALRELASLPTDQRRARGDELNRARRSLEALVEERARALRSRELEARLRTDRVDVTLPGKRPARGYSHLIEQTRRDILDVFVGFGYVVVDGPEVDLVHYNFDALNHAPTHPSRAQLKQLTSTSTDGSVNGKKRGRRRTSRSAPKIARANPSSVPLRCASVIPWSTTSPSICVNIAVWVASGVSRR